MSKKPQAPVCPSCRRRALTHSPQCLFCGAAMTAPEEIAEASPVEEDQERVRAGHPPVAEKKKNAECPNCKTPLTKAEASGFACPSCKASLLNTSPYNAEYGGDYARDFSNSSANVLLVAAGITLELFSVSLFCLWNFGFLAPLSNRGGPDADISWFIAQVLVWGGGLLGGFLIYAGQGKR